jgi:hypothetical protein
MMRAVGRGHSREPSQQPACAPPDAEETEVVTEHYDRVEGTEGSADLGDGQDARVPHTALAARLHGEGLDVDPDDI